MHGFFDTRVGDNHVSAHFFAIDHNAHGAAVFNDNGVNRRSNMQINAVSLQSVHVRVKNGNAAAVGVSGSTSLGLPLQAACEFARRQAILGNTAVNEANLAHASMRKRIGGVFVQEFLERHAVIAMRLFVGHVLHVGNHLDNRIEVLIGNASLQVARELEDLATTRLNRTNLGKPNAVINAAALQQANERALAAARNQMHAKVNHEVAALGRTNAAAECRPSLVQSNLLARMGQKQSGSQTANACTNYYCIVLFHENSPFVC